MNFKSADDQEKAPELSETKLLGYEIKLKRGGNQSDPGRRNPVLQALRLKR